MTGFARDFTGRECTEMSFGMSCVCRECQRRKSVPQRPPGRLVPIPPAIAPFHRIGIDLLGRFQSLLMERAINGKNFPLAIPAFRADFIPGRSQSRRITTASPSAHSELKTKIVDVTIPNTKWYPTLPEISYGFILSEKSRSLEKLLRRYFGPYQVLRRLSAVTYEVQDFDPASRKLEKLPMYCMNPDHSLECILVISRIFEVYKKQEFIASWACSQFSVVSSSQR
ncbi:integrase catalytic domain-containing protein [Trichonephila clavipes]|nr:integrase catalytic domain-containing protein [Trichonephila clavipes]